MNATVSTAAPRPRASHTARELILKAATEVFIAHGFNGAGIDQIALQAGVSKPTIYSHFESKEQLFIAIMNSICDNFEAPFLDPDGETDELPVLLLRIANNYTRAVLQPKVVAMHRRFVAESEQFPDLARRYFEVGPLRVHKTLARFFEQRMARGEIRPMDPMILAQFFAALIIAPLRTRRLFAVETESDAPTMERYNREAVRLFLDGCR